MRVIEIPKPGPPSILRLREVPDPRPREGEVVVEVRASGVNFADVMGRLGLYPDAPAFPYVPGYEVSGTVDGQPVIAATRFKGYAEKVAVPKADVVSLPKGLSFLQGAALPVNYLTAWVALEKMARVNSGDRVLIEQAAGGVGLAAIQIALHAGAEVYGVAGTAAKCEFLARLGARPVLRGAQWPERLDVILDPTGWQQQERSFRHLAPAGRLVLYGASTLVKTQNPRRLGALWEVLTRSRLDPIALMNRNQGVFGLNLLSYWSGESNFQALMQPVLEGVKEGWLWPHISHTFALEKAAEAHTCLQERRNIGKVVLTTGTQEG